MVLFFSFLFFERSGSQRQPFSFLFFSSSACFKNRLFQELKGLPLAACFKNSSKRRAACFKNRSSLLLLVSRTAQRNGAVLFFSSSACFNNRLFQELKGLPLAACFKNRSKKRKGLLVSRTASFKEKKRAACFKNRFFQRKEKGCRQLPLAAASCRQLPLAAASFKEKKRKEKKRKEKKRKEKKRKEKKRKEKKSFFSQRKASILTTLSKASILLFRSSTPESFYSKKRKAILFLFQEKKGFLFLFCCSAVLVFKQKKSCWFLLVLNTRTKQPLLFYSRRQKETGTKTCLFFLFFFI